MIWRYVPFSWLQASCPLCHPIRRGPFFGGLFRELLCEWQCDQAGDGLDAWPAVGLLHQLGAAVAGRSSALCAQSMEVESILRYVGRYGLPKTQFKWKREWNVWQRTPMSLFLHFAVLFLFGTEGFQQNLQLNQHSWSAFASRGDAETRVACSLATASRLPELPSLTQQLVEVQFLTFPQLLGPFWIRPSNFG